MDDFDPRGQEALAKLEQDERRARRRTVLYSLVPVGMGVLLVLYTGQKVASATRELAVLRDSTELLRDQSVELRDSTVELRTQLEDAERRLIEATNLDRFSHPIDFVDLKLLASRYPAASRALEIILTARERETPWRLGGDDPATGFDSPGFAAWVLDQMSLLPRETGEGLVPASRALANRLPSVPTPRAGDLAIYPGGYVLFWFTDQRDEPFVIGMTPSGVTALDADFAQLVGYRRVEYR
jgi:hypothetical protein